MDVRDLRLSIDGRGGLDAVAFWRDDLSAAYGASELTTAPSAKADGTRLQRKRRAAAWNDDDEDGTQSAVVVLVQPTAAAAAAAAAVASRRATMHLSSKFRVATTAEATRERG